MGSQIKNEQSFNIASVFTNLQQSRLEIEILDHLIFIIKNSPSNVRVDIKSTNIFDFLAFEENMIEEHNKLIIKKRFV
jgi:hypothetical protein